MEEMEVLNKIKLGRFFNINWTSIVPVNAQAKKDGHIVLKTCEAIGRCCTYEEMGIVKDYKQEREEEGNPVEKKELWWKWKIVNIIKVNKKDENKKYLAVKTGANNTPKVQYYIDGKEATKEEVMESGLVNASYFKPQPIDTPFAVFDLPLANINFIN